MKPIEAVDLPGGTLSPLVRPIHLRAMVGLLRDLQSRGVDIAVSSNWTAYAREFSRLDNGAPPSPMFCAGLSPNMGARDGCWFALLDGPEIVGVISFRVRLVVGTTLRAAMADGSYFADLPPKDWTVSDTCPSTAGVSGVVAHIGGLVIDPRFRGRGLAGVVTPFVQLWAMATHQPTHYVSLAVPAVATAIAHRYYRFRRRETYVRMTMWGKVLDMELLLATASEWIEDLCGYVPGMSPLVPNEPFNVDWRAVAGGVLSRKVPPEAS